MNPVFDLVEEINERAAEYFYRTGFKPNSLAVSPGSYRRLIEIASSEQAIGNLVVGCRALRDVTTGFGKVHVVIDEIMSDTEVELS